MSNTPGATVVDAGNPATPTLTLLSSNLLQEPSAGEVFQQWLGEVKNNGPTLVCLLRADVTFLRGDGIPLASFTAFATGDPYMLGTLSLTSPCLQPGQIGSFYDNNFAAAAISLSEVSRIAVKFSPSAVASAVPAPHAPLLTSHEGPVFDGFGVIGTLTGQVAPIRNIGLEFYPRNTAGLVLDRLFATDLDTLQPGGTFPFTTLSTPASFTQYRSSVDFIDGPATVTAVAGARQPGSVLDDAAATIDAARREHRAAVQERAQRARGR